VTLATAFTLLRLAALVPLAFLINMPHHPALSLAVFGCAVATDWADGAIARRWDQATALGARLDALVDKVFIFVLMLLLWRAGIFVWHVVGLALFRDVVVQMLRTGVPAEEPIPANRWGKMKFLLQCIGVGSALVALHIPSATVFRITANAAVIGAVFVSLPGLVIVLRQRAHVRAVRAP
jgi:CDP-diacylglycerol--glycerol-3-phosphate 3-phosphatidyltransferase